VEHDVVEWMIVDCVHDDYWVILQKYFTMSVDKFNSRMRDIEASHPDFFKGRRIFSYYALDQDRNTEKYILSFFENRPLPKHIHDEIQKVYDTLFPQKNNPII
jgi:hypothetical protein